MKKFLTLILLLLLPWSAFAKILLRQVTYDKFGHMIFAPRRNYDQLPAFYRVFASGNLQITIRTGCANGRMSLVGSDAAIQKFHFLAAQNRLYLNYPAKSKSFKYGKLKVNLCAANIEEIEAADGARIIATDLNTKHLIVTARNDAEIKIEGKRLPLQKVVTYGNVNVRITGVRTASLTVLTDSIGIVRINGSIGLKRLTHKGDANVYISGLTGVPLVVDYVGSGETILRGNVQLRRLNFRSNGALYIDSINAVSLNVYAAYPHHNRGRLRLTGNVLSSHMVIGGDMHLDARYLRSSVIAVKTFDYARADVYPLLTLYAIANNESNIYYYHKPLHVSQYMYQLGSVLDVSRVPTAFATFH